MHGLQYLSRLTILILLVVVLVAEIFRRYPALEGLIHLVWWKITERVLPPRPVHWLTHYHHKHDVWRRLVTTKDFEQRPNILLIVADDLGVNDVSGGSGIATPFIDSIAKNGLNFTDAYSSQSTCAPSRAALFTGRFPTSIGYEFTPVPKIMSRFMAMPVQAESPQPIYHKEYYAQVPEMEEVAMPKEVPTIAELLHEVGYHNYLIGKWDGGFTEDTSPLARGFDEVLSFLVGGSLYAKVNDPNIVSADEIAFDNFLKRILSFKVSHNNEPFFEPDEYLTDYLGKQSSQLIRDLASKRSEAEGLDQPWFMAVTYTAPHNPFQALRTDYEHPDIQKIPTLIGRIYAAMILALDRNVGRMIQALRDTNQYDNTLIIFTSDNGAATYVGLPDLNAPYRGWKGTLFEGGIRIPFLLQWPKKILEVNQKVKEMIMHIDIMPTLVSIASKGIQFIPPSMSEDPLTNETVVPPRITNMVTDGSNILTNFILKPASEIAVQENLHHRRFNSSLGLGDESRTFFWRSGDYKAIRHGNYKLQVHSNPPKLWFYNLLLDPTERLNLLDYINTDLDQQEWIVSQNDLERFLIRHNSSLTFELSQQRETVLVDQDKSVFHRQQKGRFSRDIVEITHLDHYNREVLLSNLINMYQKLQDINSKQRSPIWQALAELPVCIDKPSASPKDCLLTDEYILWAN